MNNLHIITPVKDSWETTRRTIDAVMASVGNVNFDYSVYNDFSSDENTQKLISISQQYKLNLINLKDVTTHPSPNYFLILCMVQARALSANSHLLIVESDVIVEKNTIQQLFDYAASLEKAGMVSAVTTDEQGNINFPNLYAKNYKKGVVATHKRISFCCTLLTNNLLASLDLNKLNDKKDWFDVAISRLSRKNGFRNYLITSSPVVHLPHSSRPWKLLKYSNPLKYYWLKWTKQLKTTK